MDINSIMGGDRADTSAARSPVRRRVDEAMLKIWVRRMQPESHQALWDMSMFNLPRTNAMSRPPMLILGAEHDVLVPLSSCNRRGAATGCPHMSFATWAMP